MGDFQAMLSAYQQNYLDYKLTGDAAKKTAYEAAQQTIETYLQSLRASMQKNQTYVDTFLQEYAQTNPELVKAQQKIREARQEGPKAQDDLTRIKRMEPPPMDWTPYYIKAGLVGGLAAVIILVSAF